VKRKLKKGGGHKRRKRREVMKNKLKKREGREEKSSGKRMEIKRGIEKKGRRSRTKKTYEDDGEEDMKNIVDLDPKGLYCVSLYSRIFQLVSLAEFI
jgi:hypothetical protein